MNPRRVSWPAVLAVSISISACGAGELIGVHLSGGRFSGELSTVIGNPLGGNGLKILRHTSFPDTGLFATNKVGLFFEHINNGMTRDVINGRFTPNRDPHFIVQHSEASASLIHPAQGNSWGLDSEMRFTLDGESVDLDFNVTPTQDKFDLGYAMMMWASYMENAVDRRIHFWGVRTDDDGAHHEGWVSFGESAADGSFETGTVGFDGESSLPYQKLADGMNLADNPKKKFLLPFYYGIVDADGDFHTEDDRRAYIMMFDQAPAIRFALWNFNKDREGNPDPRRPAWDWQFVVRNPQLGETYNYRARVLYKPFVDAEDVKAEYLRWKAGLEAPNA